MILLEVKEVCLTHYNFLWIQYIYKMLFFDVKYYIELCYLCHRLINPFTQKQQFTLHHVIFHYSFTVKLTSNSLPKSMKKTLLLYNP